MVGALAATTPNEHEERSGTEHLVGVGKGSSQVGHAPRAFGLVLAMLERMDILDANSPVRTRPFTHPSVERTKPAWHASMWSSELTACPAAPSQGKRCAGGEDTTEEGLGRAQGVPQAERDARLRTRMSADLSWGGQRCRHHIHEVRELEMQTRCPADRRTDEGPRKGLGTWYATTWAGQALPRQGLQ